MEREYRPRLRDSVEKAGKPAVDPREMKKFGYPVGAVLLLIAGLTFWRDHLLAARIFGGFGALLVLLAVIRPVALGPIYKVWMKFARALGWFNTRLILALVFYLVITPIGLLMRLLGKRPLSLQWDSQAPTYWLPRDKKEFNPAQYEKHF